MPSSSTLRHARAPPCSSRDDHDCSDHKRRNRSDIDDHRRSKDRDTSSDRRKRHREDDDRDRRRSSKHSQNSRSHRDDDRRDKSDREHRRRDRDRDHGSSSHLRHDSDRHQHHRDQHHRNRSLKQRETSEERRIRKAAKRSEKLKQLEESFIDQEEEEGAAQRTAVAELMMYSAEDNPFNDPTLGQKFKWGKKQEKERKQGLSREEAEKRDAQRRQEAMAEIEKLNAKRAEREKQAALREEEEARMARLAESAQMASWVAKEDDFHLEQAQRRAVIRVKENRAKPIDLLSINLKWADPNIIAEQEHKHHDDDDDDDDDEAGLEIDLEEPYTIFEDLTIQETEELHQDIQMYLELEKNDSHRDFWRSMLIVCDDKLEELKEEQGRSKGGAASVHLRQDPEERGRINSMLEPKSTDELQQLQDQVRAKLASGEPVDVEYWERVLKSIVVWRAKARLGVLHEAVLSNRLEYLRRKQRDEAVRQQQELLIQTGEDSVDEQQEALDAQDTVKAEVNAEEAALEALYDPDEMEPAAIDPSRLSYEEGRLAIKTLGQDLSELVAARRRVTDQIFIPKTRCNDLDRCSSNPADRMFFQEASKALDVTEEIMPTDEALSHETYEWQDKYRPRKPRFLNRVHTGFDWNKYNQTHYDSDNPPPKTVQGYKFNIFYPDLIDKNVAPTYKVVKEKGEEQTVLLRFSAGPPYEDVAFRIVNREWEYSHKRGFRNTFDRGLLQLHFNFKRLRYRK